MTRQIVIIGGGPAGIEAARTAARAGANVTLISEGPVGGRAGWHSLLPSKVWLAAADSVGSMAESPYEFAGKAEASTVVAQIQAVKMQWNEQQADSLAALGVQTLTGVASFKSAQQVVVRDGEGQVVARCQGDAVIVAAGSVPIFPPQLKPDGRWVLAPRFAGELDALPGSMVVIGAGATGCEFVYLFNRLGVDVTWIVDAYGVLPAFDVDAGRLLAEVMETRGVNMARDQLAERIEAQAGGVTVITDQQRQFQADQAFVAIGRRPDLSRLDLEAIGLPVEAGTAPPVNGFGQTDLPGLYLVGDAAGAPMVANRAMAQARVAALHAAGSNPMPFLPETAIHAIYTEPQVAQVGTLTGDHVETITVPFDSVLKTHLLPEQEGFIKLAFTQDRCVVGGVAVGPHAAEVLAPVALAVQMDASLNDLAALYPAHPTLSELAFVAARQV